MHNRENLTFFANVSEALPPPPPPVSISQLQHLLFLSTGRCGREGQQGYSILFPGYKKPHIKTDPDFKDFCLSQPKDYCLREKINSIFAGCFLSTFNKISIILYYYYYKEKVCKAWKFILPRFVLYIQEMGQSTVIKQ